MASTAGAQQNPPVIRSNASVIDIRNGEASRLQWNLRPHVRPDTIPAGLVDGRPHRVTVVTDADSVGFLVEEGKAYDLVVQRGDTASHIRIVGVRLVPTPGIVRGRITVAANPEAVCFDERRTPHLNVDLIVRNGSEKEIRITELRAFVLSPAGELLERRVAQQPAELLGPGRTPGALREGLLFNPFAFSSVRRDSRIRYEVHFADPAAPPAEVTVRLVPCVTRARLVLPLAGRIVVSDGHDVLSHHRRSTYLGRWARDLGMVDNFQRFGLDLMVADSQGRTFRGDGRRNEDYLAWGHPVRAAGAGTVAAVHNQQPDNDVIGSENLWTQRSLAENEMTTAGNYVLIDHGGGEFSLVSHLRAGSVRVQAGDRVSAGQIIAEAGNSGSSLGPHVHYELRTGWGVRGVRALPPYFHDLTVIGTGEGADGAPVMVNTGDIILTS
ncbi:M23 family metallopeptidase [Longimicrobium sp.]|uniref:M23 family metallopeptidase n=1 Tax=Longimicrobium sp. TaxID=2029185 RepID=UPI003B3A6214